MNSRNLCKNTNKINDMFIDLYYKNQILVQVYINDMSEIFVTCDGLNVVTYILLNKNNTKLLGLKNLNETRCWLKVNGISY